MIRLSPWVTGLKSPEPAARLHQDDHKPSPAAKGDQRKTKNLADRVGIDGGFGDEKRAVAADAAGGDPDFRGPAVMFDQAAAAAHLRLEAGAIGHDADLIFQVSDLFIRHQLVKASLSRMFQAQLRHAAL